VKHQPYEGKPSLKGLPSIFCKIVIKYWLTNEKKHKKMLV